MLDAYIMLAAMVIGCSAMVWQWYYWRIMSHCFSFQASFFQSSQNHPDKKAYSGAFIQFQFLVCLFHQKFSIYENLRNYQEGWNRRICLENLQTRLLKIHWARYHIICLSTTDCGAYRRNQWRYQLLWSGTPTSWKSARLKSEDSVADPQIAVFEFGDRSRQAFLIYIADVEGYRRGVYCCSVFYLIFDHCGFFRRASLPQKASPIFSGVSIIFGVFSIFWNNIFHFFENIFKKIQK